MPMQPWQERVGVLKLAELVQVVLSLYGMPGGELQGMLLSVCLMLGIQLSNRKFPL